MDLDTTTTVLDAAGHAQVPVLLWGAPGTGKTSLVSAYAEARGVPIELVLGSIREPSDLAGWPTPTEDGLVRMAAPQWAKRLVDAGDGVLFLDELTTTAPATQAALLTVALQKLVGECQLPESVQVVAGANPPESAADGYDLAAPLSNRFLHVDFAPTVASWLDGVTSGWAAPVSRAVSADPARRAGVQASVLGFVKSAPENWHVEPSDPGAAGRAWPSGRTWSMLMSVLPCLRADDDAAIEVATVGLVGEAAGLQYLSWLLAADLPDPEKVLADPTMIDWAGERPDRAWTILNAVVGFAVAKGTVAMWRQAWGPVVACGSQGAADVAAAAARPLAKARPANAKIPASVRQLAPALQAAGVIV